MKRLTELKTLGLKLGTRLVFMDRSGDGCKGSVHGEVYKLEEIVPFKIGPTILQARSVKTGTFISTYYHRFALHIPIMEENE